MYTDKRLHQLWMNCQYRQRSQPIGEMIIPLREKLTNTKDKQLAQINAVWVDIVGADLADLAFPYALQSDILIISVASPAVKFTVEQIYRQPILDQLREQTGKRIREIKCTLNASRSH